MAAANSSSRIVFTVGDKAAYDAGLAELGAQFKKRGQGHYKGVDGFYKGGAVFSTREEAQAYVDARPEEAAGWAVYGLLADIDKHCVKYDGEPFHRLVVDRQIVSLS